MAEVKRILLRPAIATAAEAGVPKALRREVDEHLVVQWQLTNCTGAPMKRFALLVFAAVVMTVGAGASAWPQSTPGQARPDNKSALNVTGQWIMTLEMSMGTASPALDLKQDGEKISGTYTGRYGTSSLAGSLKGRTIQFSFTMGTEDQPQVMAFAGEVTSDAQSMKGTASLGEMGDATWTAKRQ
jgi:hypothetical protein